MAGLGTPGPVSTGGQAARGPPTRTFVRGDALARDSQDPINDNSRGNHARELGVQLTLPVTTAMLPDIQIERIYDPRRPLNVYGWAGVEEVILASGLTSRTTIRTAGRTGEARGTIVVRFMDRRTSR